MKEDVWVPTLDESHLQEEAITLVSPKGLSIILSRNGHMCALRNRCAHVSCTLSWGTTAPRVGHQIVAPEKTVVFADRRPH
jgi:nitrite reductase/ring-hydroxylating ferredoxin subunit